jgi:hypothetical protein
MTRFVYVIMALSIAIISPLNAQTHNTAFSDLPNGAVYCTAVDDTYVYVGGIFTQCGSTARNNIARYVKSTGVLDMTFNPNADGAVNVIRVVNGSLYVGGNFTIIGGQSRNYMAKLNTTNGTANSTFNANANGEVIDIEYANGSLYVGGNFFSIGGQLRFYIAKLDPTNGSADGTFDPNASNRVFDIEYANGSLYVSGSFFTIGGQGRNRIAKLDTTNGAVDGTFNPNANNDVFDIEYVNGSLYVGGDFTTIGGQGRNRIVKLDTINGDAAADFDIGLNGSVYGFYGDVITVDNGVLYFGGDFTAPASRFFVFGSLPSTTIPTVGEWAMIVLTLSLFCVAVMYVRKSAFALHGAGQARGLPVQNMQQNLFLGKEDFVFSAKWFFPLSFIVTACVWSACVYCGETAVRDMIGTTLTGIVGGYLLQLLALWVMEKK